MRALILNSILSLLCDVSTCCTVSKFRNVYVNARDLAQKQFSRYDFHSMYDLFSAPRIFEIFMRISDTFNSN